MVSVHKMPICGRGVVGRGGGVGCLGRLGKTQIGPEATMGGTQQVPTVVFSTGGHSGGAGGMSFTLMQVSVLGSTVSSSAQQRAVGLAASRCGGQQFCALSKLPPTQHWPAKSDEVAAREPGLQKVVGLSGFLQPSFWQTKLHPGKPGNFSHTLTASCPHNSWPAIVMHGLGLRSSGPPMVFGW